MDWRLVPAVGTQPKLQTMPAYDIYSQSGVSLDDGQREGKGCWRHAQSGHRLSFLPWPQDLENIWVYGQVAHARGQEVRGSDPPGASYGINFENWYFFSLSTLCFLKLILSKTRPTMNLMRKLFYKGLMHLRLGCVSNWEIRFRLRLRCDAIDR